MPASGALVDSRATPWLGAHCEGTARHLAVHAHSAGPTRVRTLPRMGAMPPRGAGHWRAWWHARIARSLPREAAELLRV